MKIDLDMLWDKLNDIEYIVLRNYLNASDEVAKGGDIDLLCASRDVLIERLHLVSRANDGNLNNCKTIINGVEIPIDVRYIGDNYYDHNWENDMIKRKKKFGKCYVIGEYDEDYSILYHILLHKYDIPSKYNGFLKKKFGNIETNILIDRLAEYMRSNGYSPENPVDKGVCFNQSNYITLLKRIKNE